MKHFKELLWGIGGLIFLAVLSMAFATGISATPYLEAYIAGRTMPLRPFGEAWTYLEHEFYGSLPPADVRLRGAIDGILQTLDDPRTVLIAPQSAQEEQQRLSGYYGDVGLSLWWMPEGAVGVTPYPDSPAERASILNGDRLLSIDGFSLTKDIPLTDVAQQLQGEVDSTVTLTLHRPPTLTLTFTVTRAEVLLPSVEWRQLDASIGYLKINLFTEQTANEIEVILNAQPSNLSDLLLDLRGNGGGMVAPLPRLGGIFLQENSILYYEMDTSAEQRIAATGARLFDGPLVTLVDEGTASAAEILAAALQENGRTVVIGQPTFGKGSLQRLYPLPDGSTLHVTTAIWLTPQRNVLDAVGVQPDITVAPRPDSDAILDAALKHLGKVIE